MPLADERFYLPSDMIVKVDRMSMANGLEIRVPFLIDVLWILLEKLIIVCFSLIL